MWAYLLIFLLIATMALSQQRALSEISGYGDRSWSITWLFVWLMLTMFIGLRYEVGGDWDSYLAHVDNVKGDSLINAMEGMDPAYAFLEWIGSNYWGGIYLVNIICAAIFTWGLLVFCRTQPRPWLALLIAVPFLITVVAMGYTRQAAAIGLSMVGFTSLMQRKILAFVLWVVIATLFHKTAMILIPFVLFLKTNHRLLTLIGLLIVAALLFFLLIWDYIDILDRGYIEANYNSSGAEVRVFMNALPAFFFLLLKKKFVLLMDQDKFWSWMSATALCFIALLLITPSSTAVDRLALYWMPIQIFVWARAPEVLSNFVKWRALCTFGVVLCSGAIQFIWLFFAEHAFAWLPYKFYPWEWMWS